MTLIDRKQQACGPCIDLVSGSEKLARHLIGLVVSCKGISHTVNIVCIRTNTSRPSHFCVVDASRLSFLNQSLLGFAVNRARSVMNLYNKVPEISKSAFIAPSAVVSGQVSIGSNSSVFYGSVLRGASLLVSMEISKYMGYLFTQIHKHFVQLIMVL